MSEITTERIPTAGFTSHVLHSGVGHERAVVLAHGGGPGVQATSNWLPTLAGLGDDVHVIAPDMAGFGETDHPDPPPYGPAAWLDRRIDQVIGLADHFGHERVDIVGNSLGGAFALRFALARPERLGRLILMGSAGAPFPPLPGLVRLLSFGDDPTAENLASVLRSFVYDEARFGDLDALVQARLPKALDPVLNRSWHAMFHDEQGELAAQELAVAPERLATIEHEALVVHGRDDQIIDPKASQWLFEQLPNADIHVFSRCGHWVMLEQVERFNRLVLDFVLEGERVAA